MSIDAGDFRRALGQFASGVTVVTTRDASGRPLGLTVSAFCSVSLLPPLVLVSVDRRSETQAGFEASGLFGVSVLAEDQESISRRFAVPGSAKFEGLDLVPGESGVVLVPGALAHIECRVTASHGSGDHVLHVGEIRRLQAWPGRPLLYHGGAYRRLAPDRPGAPETGGGSDRDRV
jgi:4-hydroxyphenylacetate 3-hydroxylase, reductase component